MIKLRHMHYCLLALLAMWTNSSVLAQTSPQYYNANTSTGSNAIPLGPTFSSNKVHFLYGPGVFNSNGSTGTPSYPGVITTVYFRLGTANPAVVYSDFTISLSQNVGTSLTFPSTTFGTFTPNFYQASYSLTGATSNSWYSVTLTTPFTYDPTQSLIFELKTSATSGSSTTTQNGMLQSSMGQRLYAAYTATSGSTSSLAVDFGFDLVPSGPCTSPPNPGNATVSNANPCLGQSINLNLVGNSYGTGQTYQWESATSLSGSWTPEGAAASTTFFTATPAAPGTIYYRCAVTCGSSTVYSDTLTVNIPTPFPGGTYTINSAAATGGSNFQSFTDAMSAIGCGISGPIVFNVVPGSGPYNEQIIMPNTIGSNSTNTITINGNGATVQDTATAASTGILMMDGVDYVKIDSLNFKSLDATFGSGAILYNGCNFDSITRCTFDVSSVTATASTNFGIRIAVSPTGTSSTVSGATNTYIGYCTIKGSSTGNNGIYYGLYAYGPNTNNVYHNNTVINAYLYSMYVYYGDSNTISNNLITRETKTGTGYCYGLYTNSLAGGSKVLRNRIEYLGGATDNASYCYPLQVVSAVGTSASPILAANNIIGNMTSVPLYGLYINGGSYVDVYHNTVSIDLPLTYSTTTNQSGIYSSGTSVNIQNNIVSYTGGGPNTKYGIYLSSAPATCDYNNFYMNSSVSGTQNYGYSGSSYATFAAFQGATSFEINGRSEDPMFASAATGDFTPTNSLIDNMGTPVASVTTDINGVPRDPVTPDMGAIEFSVPPCSGTPVAGTATASDTAACIGGPIDLNLAGFTIGTGITIQWQESYAPNSWTDIIGATNASYTATYSGPVEYRAAVSCNAGTPVYSNVLSVHDYPKYACYCSPMTGQPLHTNTSNYITKVEIVGTALNNPTSTVGAGGYTRNYPPAAATTASLTQAVNYGLSVSLSSASYTAIAWIDYDHNGMFDPGEETVLTNGYGTINIPTTALTGLTGLRVRAANATAYNNGDACSNLTTGYETEDYIIDIIANQVCTGTPSTGGMATVNRDTLCVIGDVKLSLTGYPLDLGIAINWQASPAGLNNFTDIPGASLDTFTMTGISSSMDFRARVTCTSTGGGTAYSNVLNVVVSNPSMLTTISGSRCDTGSVALYAQAANGGSVNWYDVPTGGSPLGTGNIFITPSITSTTPYYAAPTTGSGGVGSVGPVSPASVGSGGGTSAAITTYHMAFDVLVPTTLLSVDIYPTAAVNSSGAIAIQDNASNTLITVPYTTTVTGGTTPQTIPINLALAPGTGYKMGQSTAIALFRNTAGASYPYTSPSINIISNNFGPTYYYYFYNWQFSSGCEGARTQVNATINPAGTGNLATGGTVVDSNQADGTTVAYDAPCSDKVAAVTDAPGGNVLGNTSATVRVAPGVQTYNNLPYVPRVYDISPASDGPATITIYALQSEFNAYNSHVTTNSLSLPLLPTSGTDPNISNIVVTQWHGDAHAGTAGPGGVYAGPATFIPNTAITASTNGTYWTLTFPVAGFSGFFIHTGATPLPIQLASISAGNFGNRNRIDWMTAEEKEAKLFELQRSNDAKVFTTITKQEAAGRANSYSYWDEQPLNGMNYYRLKMYDKNGSFRYSDVVKAFVNQGDAFFVEAYPNPVSDMLTIKLNGVKSDNSRVLITDLTGKVIKMIDMVGTMQEVSLSTLASGVYLIKYLDEDHTQTIRVNKQ